ncbi:hypothetical protein ACHAWF_002470 [Thalassiosira exigua]
MLILAPATKSKQNTLSISKCIQQRMLDFSVGGVQVLYQEAMKVSSWRAPSDRLDRPENRATQEAADSDNFRTVKARVCNVAGVAPINDRNIETAKGLHPDPLPPLGRAEPKILDQQDYHLPGDICDTIRRAPRTTAAGVNCDTLDAFVDLVKLGDEALNNNIRRVFNLRYRGQVPQAVRRFLSDGYLFCLYKDPHDRSKLRPLGVPSALRRLIASHVCRHGKAKFAMDLLPYKIAIGVPPGGMNFLTRSSDSSKGHRTGTNARLEPCFFSISSTCSMKCHARSFWRR